MLFFHTDFSAIELRWASAVQQPNTGPRLNTGRTQASRPAEHMMVRGRFARGRRGPDGIWRRDNS